MWENAPIGTKKKKNWRATRNAAVGSGALAGPGLVKKNHRTKEAGLGGGKELIERRNRQTTKPCSRSTNIKRKEAEGRRKGLPS